MSIAPLRFSARSLPILSGRSWSPRISKNSSPRRDLTSLNVCCNFASGSSFTRASYTSYTQYPMSNRSGCSLRLWTSPHRLYSPFFRILNCHFSHSARCFSITSNSSYSFYISLPPTHNIRFEPCHTSSLLRIRSVPALNCSSYGLLQSSLFLVDTLPLVTSSPTGPGLIRRLSYPFDWRWCKSCSRGTNDAKYAIRTRQRRYIWSELGWRHDDFGPDTQHYGNLSILLPPEGVWQVRIRLRIELMNSAREISRMRWRCW